MPKSGKFIMASLLVLAVLLIYGLTDPASNSIFPKCPFLSLTGYQCPGCGSQRATHQLLNGDIIKAFQLNAIFVIALPYLFVGALFEIPSLKNRFHKVQRILFGQKTIYLILAVILLFWVFRNI